MSYTAEPKQQDTNIKVPLISKIAYGITAIVLFFYRISKRSYNQIMSELNAKKTG